MIPGMPNTPAQLTFDDPDVETALFRHGLIAHLIHHPPNSGQLEAELRQLAAQTYVIPHASRKRTRVSLASLRRYYRTYRAHGFEALLPKSRRDAGVPLAIDPAVLQRAIALREQQPERTTPMLVEILKREGHTVNAHTLATHLRQAGKTRKLLGGNPRRPGGSNVSTSTLCGRATPVRDPGCPTPPGPATLRGGGRT